jgi:hypothetical protein
MKSAKGVSMNRTAVIFGLSLLLAPATARAGPLLLTYSGTLVTGGPVGSLVHGTALFPNALPDLIPGPFENWWQAGGFAAFTFEGNGIDFSTTTGPTNGSKNSELRIKDGVAGEDALRYDGTFHAVAPRQRPRRSADFPSAWSIAT